MSKMKRAVAIALAAAMTMGSTLTAFAADGTSGETHGSGENEGHVDKEVINVVLPTMPEEGSPFDYVTDPERLIKATAGARYEDYTFPNSDTDTGVYFRVGEKEFSNTSKTLQVINKSSCDVTISVTANVTAVGDKDLALATSSTTSKDNPLYLNLKVGTTDTTIKKSDDPQPVSKTIEGKKDNFEVQFKDGAYQYVTTADAAFWNALNFSVNGAVFEGTVEAETTAPTLDVTWSYAKAADDATADTTEQVQYEETEDAGIVSISDFIKADPKDVVIKFSLGKGPGAVVADGVGLAFGENKTTVNKAKYTLDMKARTITINGDAPFLASAATGDLPIYVTLTNGTSTVKTLEGSIAISDVLNEEPKIVSITTYNKTSQNGIVITFSLGEGDLAVDADSVKLTFGPDKTVVNAAKYTLDMSAKTVTIDGTAPFLASASASGNFEIQLTLTKGSETVKELVGTVTVVE